MKQITVSTNLHCNNCVTKLGRVLDTKPGIHHWHADVTKPGKPLTIHGQVTNEEVLRFIGEAGFEGHSVTENDTHAAPLPEQEKDRHFFWRDPKLWKRASFNTLNCLIGCSIGDFAMIVFLQTNYPSTPMFTQMILAAIAGLMTSVALESAILHYREKLVWKGALKMAVSMSFISMVAMEIAMNATDFIITGGKAALGSPVYWLAFIPAALAGFLTPLPYNYYQLKKYNHSCH
jgi:cation transport ATPase